MVSSVKNLLRVVNRRFPTMVPRRGLEPPSLAALAPKASAYTNSATWAGHQTMDIELQIVSSYK